MISLARNAHLNGKRALVVCRAYLSLKTLACSIDSQDAIGFKQILSSNGEHSKRFVNAKVLTLGHSVISLRPLTPP
jgi:hypothetical protein